MGAARWKQLTKEARKYWVARGAGRKSEEKRVIAKIWSLKKAALKRSYSN